MSNETLVRHSIVKLSRLVFAYPNRETGWNIEKYLNSPDIRYFSYGRHAIRTAIETAGIGMGDTVLLPSFICREILSSINVTGANPIYYNVDESLQLSLPQESLPHASAILAVNFFGFPQDIAPFRAFCNRTGAILIEDNAHGFLSRDKHGTILGTRGDFGIFSLRKTIPIPNGAALLINTKGRKWALPPQPEPSKNPISISFKIKQNIRHLVPFIGVFLPVLLTTFGRKLRKFRRGHEIAPSPPDAEKILPGSPSPCAKLKYLLNTVDVDWETDRRRNLYITLNDLIRDSGGKPVFDSLPENTVPYGFPFRAEGEPLKAIRRRLSKLGLECHPWPDLPDEIASNAPEHYKSVWMVGFLW